MTNHGLFGLICFPYSPSHAGSEKQKEHGLFVLMKLFCGCLRLCSRVNQGASYEDIMAFTHTCNTRKQRNSRPAVL